MTGFFRELNRAAIGPSADLGAMLRNLVEQMGWLGFAVWTYNPEAVALKRVHHWTRPDERGARHERSAKTLYAFGEGLPGLAWGDGAVAGAQRADADRYEVALPIRLAERSVAVLVFATGPGPPVTEELRTELEEAGQGAFAHLYSMYHHTLVPVVLTARELEVLQWSAQGHGTAQMAVGLHVATSTVKTHLENLYAKLGVTDRAAAVAQGFRRGLIV